MDKLNLPPYSFNVKEQNGSLVIQDVLRKKFVALTPEEWVRQHFTHFLMEYLSYPAALLANEVELRCGVKRLRCDSILYDRTGRPKMIIEYKAPKINITQKVFDQVTAYNLLLKVDYLVISNGLQHYCCKMDYDTSSYHFLTEIPRYDAL